MSARPGTVYLVGAGPGDPGLITVRGLELLESCDVVVYDRLVAQTLVERAPAAAERISVGKRPGQPHSRQLVADALLLKKAAENKAVVRLKGGDPFVFGRGGEEALLLAEAGVPFEVVPGVTSAVAVPAYAGIPVTHRGLAASFAVLTGHAEKGLPAGLERAARAADTLVLLMGVGALAEVCSALIAAGRAQDEPAAVIEWGTTAAQRVVTGTLSDIPARAADAGIAAPATTVVGRVVALRQALAWAERRPLWGRAIVLTRAAGTSGELAAALADLGAEVVELPAIVIAPVDDPGPLDAALARLAQGGYDWVLFASANAVAATFARLSSLGLDARAVRARVGAVGPATARALEARGISADVVPARHTAQELIAALGRGPGRVLLPRVEGAPPGPAERLAAAGFEAHEVPVYRNSPPAAEPAVLGRVRAGGYDAVVFTSPSTVRNFVALAGPPQGKVAVCIGPATAAAARRAGLGQVTVADEASSAGLAAALLRALVGGSAP